jgi:hypothetical protein
MGNDCDDANLRLGDDMKSTTMTILFAATVACGGGTDEPETPTETMTTETGTMTTETGTMTTETGTETGTNSTYGDISSLINSECAGCHGGGSPAEDLNLEGAAGYDAIVGVASEQAAMDLVTPGDLAESYFYHKMAGTHVDAGGSGTQMPMGADLSSMDIEKVATWILDGALP